MAHIKLNLFLQSSPRHSKFRRRIRRKLRAVRPSKKVELWYRVQLMRIVRLLEASVRRNILPALKNVPEFRGDALPLSLALPFATVQEDFKGIERTAARLARIAAQRSLEQVDARLTAAISSSVGVDISGALTTDGPIRAAIEEAVKANTELITSIPEQYLGRLRAGLESHFTGGGQTLVEQIYPDLRREMKIRYGSAPPAYFEDMTPEEIADRIDEITENRAQLIARDQTSKMNSSFNEARQTSVGIDRYEWQTAGDERVRDSHAEKDGQIFSWDEPPEDTGHPGEDINCRCVAIPVFDLDTEEEEQ